MFDSPQSFYSLLITESTDQDSNQTLKEILTQLGSLELLTTGRVLPFPERKYNLIIVDAVSVKNPIEIVSQIRVFDTKTKIVVVSASRHWKIAKAIFQAGATDYLPKSLTKEEMLSHLQEVLGQDSVAETKASWRSN